MAQLNVSEAKKRLDGYCILIADAKLAKMLHIKKRGIVERDLSNEPTSFSDKAGYFKGTAGGGISDEKNVDKEQKKRFYKTVTAEIYKGIQKYNCNKLVIMIPEQDLHLINQVIPKSLQKKICSTKTGNFIKASLNDVLETVLEVI